MAKNEEIPESKLNLKHRVVKKYEQIKAHVRRNEKAYYIGSMIIVAGVTFLVTRRVILRNMAIEEISIDFFNKPTRNLVEVTVPETNVGNDILNPGSRVGFFSQQSAGRAYGVSEPVLSSHLQGTLPDIKGEILERTNFRIFAEVEK
jgi:hypothetical protein